MSVLLFEKALELWEYGQNRRTLKKSEELGLLDYKNPRQIYTIIHRNEWPYKRDIELLHKRDLALASLLFLSSGRIGEVLRLKKNQFTTDEDYPDFVILSAFYVSKRKKGKTHPTPDIPLPLRGRLSAFTYIALDYVKLLEPDEKLFKFSRARAWAIIRCITASPDEPKGYWCHWFRAQSLSYMVNLIRSTVAVARQRGVENPATLAHYYRGDWRQFANELKQ